MKTRTQETVFATLTLSIIVSLLAFCVLQTARHDSLNLATDLCVNNAATAQHATHLTPHERWNLFSTDCLKSLTK